MKEGQDNKKKNMKKIDKDTIMINKIINKSIMEKDNRSRDKKDQNNNKKVKRFILSKIILKQSTNKTLLTLRMTNLMLNELYKNLMQKRSSNNFQDSKLKHLSIFLVKFLNQFIKLEININGFYKSNH